MMERPVVYISGPMTIGDWEENILRAERLFRQLMLAGYSCYCPHLSGRMPGHEDIPHDLWIANDLPLVGRSDAVLRIPGESTGADRECAFARACEVPVYHSVEHLMDEIPPDGEA